MPSWTRDDPQFQLEYIEGAVLIVEVWCSESIIGRGVLNTSEISHGKPQLKVVELFTTNGHAAGECLVKTFKSFITTYERKFFQANVVSADFNNIIQISLDSVQFEHNY